MLPGAISVSTTNRGFNMACRTWADMPRQQQHNVNIKIFFITAILYGYKNTKKNHTLWSIFEKYVSLPNISNQ
jgi:hypothetical protein